MIIVLFFEADFEVDLLDLTLLLKRGNLIRESEELMRITVTS